jgi:glycosyltransferase involved in cell wall biosynthesis
LPWFDEPLEGDPPVVLLTGGWLPNRDSLTWFLEDIWPGILGANPDAHAHIFGPDQGAAGPSVSCHPAPADSLQLFRPGTVLAVPLRIASGIRMKILESWARRVPVVATPTAVRGLEDVGEHGYLLARNGAEFGAAVARLRRSREVAQQLIEAGRKTLADHFEPQHAAELLEVVYREAIARSGNRHLEN